MMKIAHVTPFFDPEYYGSHEYFLSLELKKLGNEIRIITSDLHSLWGGATNLRGKFKCGVDKYHGLEIFRIRSFGRIAITPLIFNITEVLQRERYDVILTHELFHFASFCSAIAARKLKIPLILFQHGYSGGRRIFYRILFRLNYWIMGRYVLQQAAKIIALSNSSAEFSMNLGKESAAIEIIPTGVDTTLFNITERRRLSQNGKIVLFVGRLIKEKGIYCLVNTIKEIVSEVRNVRLFIVGTGPEEKNLKNLCNNLNINNHVIFAGRVKNKDMPKIYEKANFLVLPTLTNEPFGNVLLEAMASGKPVIGSDIGGIKDIIIDGETGYKIEPGNSHQLKEKMLLLLNNENLSFHMGQKARIWTGKKFSWPIIGRRVNDLLGTFCSKNAIYKRFI